jgi:hypothetical protein
VARRRDGKAFIPAGHTVDDLWIDRQGRRRSAADLYDKYVLIPIDDEPRKRSKRMRDDAKK